MHDRGKVLTQAMLMLAGGGESSADIEALRAQEHLFGPVPSDSTLYRTFRQIGPGSLDGVWEAMAGVRAQVWARSSVTNTAESVFLDMDTTLVEVHSENKDGTAPTYKRGFGFHPMLCFADTTGEALAARLRPGNAGAGTPSPITSACSMTPSPSSRRRSPPGIGPARAPATWPARWWCAPTRPAARTGSWPVAGTATSASPVSGPSKTEQVAAAISRTFTDPGPARWAPARRQDGAVRDGASVAELTTSWICPTGRWASG